METIAKGLLSSDVRIRLLKKILNMSERNLRVRSLLEKVGMNYPMSLWDKALIVN